MQQDKLTDFDLELRSMLQDAQEEVPSGVWESLDLELGKRERGRIVALRWKRAASGIAAAAVLAGVFIALNKNSVISTPEALPEHVMVAEAPNPQVVQILMADASTEGPAVKKVYKGFEPVMPMEEISVEEHEQVSEEVEDMVETKVTVPSEMRKPVVSDITEENLSDIIVGHSPRRGVTFNLGGNVASNDKDNASLMTGPNRIPSLGQKAEEGITEQSRSTFGIPLTFGLSAKYNINDRFAIGSGINYSLLTRSFNGTYTMVDEFGNITRSVSSNIINELHYLGIPLNLYYTVIENKQMTFYAWGGGNIEKGVANKYRIDCKPEDLYYSTKVKGVQTSAAVGLGLDFKLNDRSGLYLDPSARYYFDCGQPTNIRTLKRFMFNFEVGLRFNLSR